MTETTDDTEPIATATRVPPDDYSETTDDENSVAAIPTATRVP